MAVPTWFALLLGAAIGVLVCGPVLRWTGGLRQAIRAQRARAPGHRSSIALLLIFATMHPAPWLLLLGLPYAAYRIATDPLRATWLCILAGALVAGVLAALVQRRWMARFLPAPAGKVGRD